MNNLMAKNSMTTRELQILTSEMDKKKKTSGASWVLWLFLGGLGGHRYYLGKVGTGLLMTFTLGCFGIWTLIDAFLLNGMIRETNDRIESTIISDLNLMSNAEQNTIAQQS